MIRRGRKKWASSYGCIMIDLPEEMARQVRDYALSIPEEFRKYSEHTSGGVPDRVHVTVKYGILTGNPEDVAGVLVGTEPFKIKLGRMSVFHNQDEIILKIGIESIGLKALNRKVCNELKNVDTFPGYRPHVTVSYMQKREGNPYYYQTFYNHGFEGMEFEASEAVFSTPDGEKRVIGFDGSIFPIGRTKKERSQYYLTRKLAGL